MGFEDIQLLNSLEITRTHQLITKDKGQHMTLFNSAWRKPRKSLLKEQIKVQEVEDKDLKANKKDQVNPDQERNLEEPQLEVLLSSMIHLSKKKS